MRNIMLTVSYDGSLFFGFQKQEDVVTVQGEIENALKKITGEDINIISAGRTDRGVHSLRHIINFYTDSNVGVLNFKTALNHFLPIGVRVLDSKEVSEDFHSRFDAKMKTYKYILNLGEQLDKNLLHKENENTYDPHVWFNTQFWAIQAKAVKDKLAEISPENKEYFESNLQAYLKSLDEATEYIQAKINEIPEESRYLITAHDAFAYFAEQFGLQVKAIQGVSTDSEIGTKQIEDLANFIVEHNIKAIFVESSVNHKSIEALQEAVKAKGGNVEIGGELYSDSMGDKENNTETYIKTIKANADTIANALK